ncbi:MAG: hypothetical protein JWL90_4741 [Chthoniobacteraceae bacterium]|nr:hypothetical protein [Chthoniobacteraceae bacterium]
MNNSFATQLSQLRTTSGLTNVELASRAKVPTSLIAGLQSGKRTIGEYQARKIGVALGLKDAELTRFIYLAIDNCTEKVLKELGNYPAELINSLGQQLRRAGIQPEQIQDCGVKTDGIAQEITVILKGGTRALIQTHLQRA